VFQKDNFERIVEILQKLLYNTRPLGPLQPRQYYSTRSASSSHKISGSAVKAILTDFYCKILLSRVSDKVTVLGKRQLCVVKCKRKDLLSASIVEKWFLFQNIKDSWCFQKWRMFVQSFACLTEFRQKFLNLN
jgi:hypothetical protein